MGRKKSSKEDIGGIGGFFTGAAKWAFVGLLWVFLIVAVTLAWFARELPDITEQMIFERRPTITIKADDGTVIDRYGDIKGETLAVKDLPKYVPEAILATEDRRFHYHFGIDPVGVLRAFFVNVTRGGFYQGGSTITQQLAKNLFLSRERTLKRKIQEAMLAIWLETKLSKDEILSAYLNRVYLGSGAYGIDAAARIYFNKSARELSLREAATIAGLLKAPSRYSPSANPGLSAQRTKVVLGAMHDAGYLDDKEYKRLEKLPPAPPRKPSSGDTIRYFTDYIVGQVEGLIGVPEEDIVVETTLDRDIQAKSEAAVAKALQTYGGTYKITQGAAMVMALDGAIVSMVGGRDYDLSEYNRAVNALRSPGSSFKPIVYLSALEHGWNPNSTINDAPISINGYRPQNYGGEYYGEVTLTEALTRSLNTVSVQLMQNVGPKDVIALARRLGITADLEPNLSLALGASGVPMIEMTTAYATLGRGGVAVEPFAIVSIKSADGKILYEQEKERSARQVVQRGYVNQIAGMMQNVVRYGTGQAAQGPYMAAGKTGTSQDFRDAWFIGFTNQYAGAVWVGNDDNSSMKKVTGGMVPAGVWREIMTAASAKPAKSYYNIMDVSNDFSFQDLLGNLLGGDNNGQQPLQQPAQDQQMQQGPPPPSIDTAPIDSEKYKWQFND